MVFAIVLTTCVPSDPKYLWEKHKENMLEDILRPTDRQNPNKEFHFSGDIFNELKDRCISINN